MITGEVTACVIDVADLDHFDTQTVTLADDVDHVAAGVRTVALTERDEHLGDAGIGCSAEFLRDATDGSDRAGRISADRA